LYTVLAFSGNGDGVGKGTTGPPAIVTVCGMDNAGRPIFDGALHMSDVLYNSTINMCNYSVPILFLPHTFLLVFSCVTSTDN
jgi:hypothetical protein